jgi:hypothetical protein
LSVTRLAVKTPSAVTFPVVVLLVKALRVVMFESSEVRLDTFPVSVLLE